MITKRQLTFGLIAALLVLALIAATLMLVQHLNTLHPLAASMVEYARAAGHVPAATAIEY